MKEIFLLDFKICIRNIKFKIGFSIMLALTMIGAILTILSQCTKDITLIQQTGWLVFFTGNSVTKLVHLFIVIAPLISIFIYSDCFIKEKDNGVSKSILNRVGKKEYIISKLLVVLLVSFLISFVSLFIQLVLIYIAIPKVGLGMEGGIHYQQYFNYLESDFLVNLKYQNIDKYNIVLIIVNSIINSLIAGVSYTISLVVRMKRLSLISISFILVIIWDMVMSRLGFKYLSIYSYQQGNYGNLLGFSIIIAIFITIIVSNVFIGFRKDMV